MSHGSLPCASAPVMSASDMPPATRADLMRDIGFSSVHLPSTGAERSMRREHRGDAFTEIPGWHDFDRGGLLWTMRGSLLERRGVARSGDDVPGSRLPPAEFAGIEKANHAKVDWRKTAYCAFIGHWEFWSFALPERSAQLARKTRILRARIAGD